MFANIQEQKRNLNQFYLVSQHTVTDLLYKANTYAAHIEGILKKIDILLAIYESLKPITESATAPNNKTKEYAQLLNNIAIELQMLRSTADAMDEQLKKLKESGDIEHKISGNLLELKKQANKTIRKVEQIISNY